MPRYRYATRYLPPAPVLPLRVGRPGDVPQVLLSALVDTGADLSVLPQGLPGRLDLPVVGRLPVAGVDGVPRPQPLYAVEVAIEHYRLVVRAVSLGPTPLVGRDVLNRLTVHLLGAQSTMDVDLPQ